MKWHLLAIFVVFLISCVSNNARDEKSYPKADSFVMRFMDSHMQLDKNDLQVQLASDEFTTGIISFIKEKQGLAGLPLIVKSMHRDGEQTVVHFQRWQYFFAYKDNRARLKADIFAIMDNATAARLEQSDKIAYTIPEYHNAKSLDMQWEEVMETNRAVYDVYMKEGGYARHAGLTKVDGGYEYNFGSYMIEADKVERYEGE